MPSRIARASRTVGLLAVALGLGSASLAAQPRLIVKEQHCYQVGESLHPGTFLLDRNRNRVSFPELVKPGTRIVVMILFGAGFKSAPDRDRFRGPLWCEDSFDDLAIQRALYLFFRDRRVQFVPVAVPPVYAPGNFGWGEDDFLGLEEKNPAYQQAVRSFIDATERHIQSGLIPFAEVFYDPRFRLAQNREERKLGTAYGEVYEWQGLLKWCEDPRRYGTPTLWILDSEGTVLTEPFFGNDYDSDPPEIQYGFKEVRDLLENLLQREGD